MSSTASTASTASNSSGTLSPFAAIQAAFTNNPTVAISAIATAGFFITSFVFAAKFLGSEERWEKIQREVVSKILPLTIIGTFFLFVTCAMYILQDPHKTMYLLLILGCLSLGLAYSAVVISVIAK